MNLSDAEKKAVVSAEAQLPDDFVFGLDIGTRSIVGTVGYRQPDGHFVVVAQAAVQHETRAMLDGQIHDIGKVADTIRSVSDQLEQLTGKKLNNVCIAAAGRVLKTVEQEAEVTFTTETVVTTEHVYSLDMLAVEKAHETLRQSDNSGLKYYCVGYSVMRYYQNDYPITNLEGHKCSKIRTELIATFLPEEVVDGLYAAVERAGLHVENLTLEPIAAINIAIPERFRLLNIALVDVGAGTSDISITKDGSIIAYGMIPAAGDELTMYCQALFGRFSGSRSHEVREYRAGRSRISGYYGTADDSKVLRYCRGCSRKCAIDHKTGCREDHRIKWR